MRHTRGSYGSGFAQAAADTVDGEDLFWFMMALMNALALKGGSWTHLSRWSPWVILLISANRIFNFYSS